MVQEIRGFDQLRFPQHVSGAGYTFETVAWQSISVAASLCRLATQLRYGWRHIVGMVAESIISSTACCVAFNETPNRERRRRIATGTAELCCAILQ
jgi:hypothetical protein